MVHLLASHEFLASVIVGDFHLVGTIITPDEADAELVIDPDRVLPCSILPERMKLIPGRRLQIPQLVRSINHAQFAARD
jgi:hypothetical protein